ncbi:hypothetical protein C0W80_18875 [Photobacterium leiognathi subsp. mandapamensis]|uniref:hypothetical protein n=1 Tax=Photobacterium leiognathi TaxID=553611 RepID=UPI000D16EBC1|nr:hypothetical protein [Photobacterium leiognathi]PSU95237.1 hypothetical protein C0W80_18875 [Photobacterium leiognathi subsp. mandapamensis]
MNNEELLSLKIQLELCLIMVRKAILLGDIVKLNTALLELEIAQKEYEMLYEKKIDHHIYQK